MSKTHVTVRGNAVKDPKLRYTRNGTPVTNIAIAVSDRRKNPTTGQWEDDNVTFYQAQCWKKEAEHVCQSVRKGDRVIAVGDLRRDEWSDENGQVKYTLLLQFAEIGLSTRFTSVRSQPRNTASDTGSQDAQNGVYKPAGASQTGWVVQEHHPRVFNPAKRLSGRYATSRSRQQPPTTLLTTIEHTYQNLRRGQQ